MMERNRNAALLDKTPKKKRREFSKKILKELRSLTNLKIEFKYRGVEQSGSSSGS